MYSTYDIRYMGVMVCGDELWQNIEHMNVIRTYMYGL